MAFNTSDATIRVNGKLFKVIFVSRERIVQ